MCKNLHMAINKDSNRLIEKARRAGGHKTKREAITAALEKYVTWHRQQRILKAFGTFEFDPAYDYKSERIGNRMNL